MQRPLGFPKQTAPAEATSSGTCRADPSHWRVPSAADV